MPESHPDLSIIVTAHAEGVLLHKTLLCIMQAAEQLSSAGYSMETIVHLDTPDQETVEYVQRSRPIEQLKARVFTNHFGDPSYSRNYCIKRASGRYVTLIDADDLFSANWPINALRLLESHAENDAMNRYIAHPYAAIEFGGMTNLIERKGEIDQATDTLLSVFANRWNVVLMADRRFLLDNPYEELAKGYGFEDWGLNCKSIHYGMHNLLVPETCLFVRRKTSGSVWDQHRTQQRVLRANDLLSFKNFRNLAVSDQAQAATASPSILRHRVKHLLTRNRIVHKAALHTYTALKRANRSTAPKQLSVWLTDAWKDIHTIERSTFPTDRPTIYQSITPEHWQAGLAYWQLIQQTNRDNYDYIVFVPWLVRGGADMYALHYIEALRRQQPDKQVAVLSMLAHDSPWRSKLGSTADFIDFGNICANLAPNVRTRLLEHFIENSGARWLHIINAAEAYEFADSHRAYLTSTGKQLIVTSFSQSVDDSERVFGYSHTHVPSVYDLSTVIMSDNQTILDVWVRDYGFDPAKLQLLRQPVHLPPIKRRAGRENPQEGIRILWAARLSPEKQPHIVTEIAKKIADLPITIEMYGSADPSYDVSFLKNLPANVTYHGAFNGPQDLHFDSYDLYLYTSLFDGMPNAILEAGAHSLPIIASRVGGIPEVISHGTNGFLVDNVHDAEAYAEAIRHLYTDRTSLNQFVKAMRQRLRKEFSAEQYESTIHQIIRKIGYDK